MQPHRQTGADTFSGFLVRQGATIHSGPFQTLEHLPHQKAFVLRRNPQTVDEVIPVKADEDIAHVENNAADHTIFTLPLVRRKTIRSDTMEETVRMVASALAGPSLMCMTS